MGHSLYLGQLEHMAFDLLQEAHYRLEAPTYSRPCCLLPPCLPASHTLEYSFPFRCSFKYRPLRKLDLRRERSFSRHRSLQIINIKMVPLWKTAWGYREWAREGHRGLVETMDFQRFWVQLALALMTQGQFSEPFRLSISLPIKWG